jgi:hypothetical protein
LPQSSSASRLTAEEKFPALEVLDRWARALGYRMVLQKIEDKPPITLSVPPVAVRVPALDGEGESPTSSGPFFYPHTTR